MFRAVMDSADMERFKGLNMNHGFIKSIVKNQIDRDEYHKVMEERKAEVQDKMRGNRRSMVSPIKRPAAASVKADGESQLYVPPHLRRAQGCTTRTSMSAPTHRMESNKRSLCPTVVSDVEETTLREKVRTRVRARMDDIDGLAIPSSSGNDQRQPAKPLFMLNMKNTDGDDIEVAVMSNDNAARLAKELGRKYGFSDDQSRLLRITLDRELESRLAAAADEVTQES